MNIMPISLDLIPGNLYYCPLKIFPTLLLIDGAPYYGTSHTIYEKEMLLYLGSIKTDLYWRNSKYVKKTPALKEMHYPNLPGAQKIYQLRNPIKITFLKFLFIYEEKPLLLGRDINWMKEALGGNPPLW